MKSAAYPSYMVSKENTWDSFTKSDMHSGQGMDV